MPTTLSREQHLEGLRAALVAFTRYADRAGLRASVPTTPDWTVRKLIVHQGMVHRWAAALVGGRQAAPDRYEREGQAAPDLLDWLRDGAIEVVTAISGAPPSLAAPVFLNDAPPAREFWARRQCHETTVHAVDALSAALGRRPKAEETWIEDDLALDGIDELLHGFLTRERSRLRCEEPMTIAVRPETMADGWLVKVGPGPAVVTREREPRGDVQLEGAPAALYLTLWNRSDEVSASDDFEQLWRNGAHVTWR